MKLLKQIERLFGSGIATGSTDGQLLERFVHERDEAAFTALVDRHGAMVLRVCRQILGNEHDAQDASQAAFLVLARRASSIGRRESVASWLHGVALRVAAKARVAATRRHTHERRAAEIVATKSEIMSENDRELYEQLYTELAQLPESFRSALVLCHLEGLTQEQAATQLGCPLGTIQSRLARGRAKLKAKLEKRGIDTAPAWVGSALQVQQYSPTPEAWADATVRLAIQFTQRNNPGGFRREDSGRAGIREDDTCRTETCRWRVHHDRGDYIERGRVGNEKRPA
jgi:RNA polymerase sigma factor (sigma-70 family)